MKWHVRIRTVLAGQRITVHWVDVAAGPNDAAGAALRWCADHHCDQLAEVVSIVRDDVAA